MEEYDCPYRKDCADNGVKCETCTYQRRSYYIPINIPYVPYQYPATTNPYHPYWGTTTWVVKDEKR